MGVSVSGMDETLAAFGEYVAVLEREQTDTMKSVANKMKDKAQLNAALQGLIGFKYSHSRDGHPGALIDKIRSRGSMHTASITEYSRTNHSYSYAYPGRYEYNGRPWMHPARDETEPVAITDLAAMLDRVRDEVGLEGH